MENKEGLCEVEVKKNLVLAEIGEPLTLSLATLNRSCDFKKEWDRIQNIWHGSNTPKEISKAYKKVYDDAYNQLSETKAKQKVYRQRPEAKAKIKVYQKIYNQRPEVQARQKAYQKIYCQLPEIKAKQKAYRQRPEVKAKIKVRMKEYYQKNKK